MSLRHMRFGAVCSSSSFLAAGLAARPGGGGCAVLPHRHRRHHRHLFSDRRRCSANDDLQAALGSRDCDRGGSCGVPGLVAVAQGNPGSDRESAGDRRGPASGFAQSGCRPLAYAGGGLVAQQRCCSPAAGGAAARHGLAASQGLRRVPSLAAHRRALSRGHLHRRQGGQQDPRPQGPQGQAHQASSARPGFARSPMRGSCSTRPGSANAT